MCQDAKDEYYWLRIHTSYKLIENITKSDLSAFLSSSSSPATSPGKKATVVKKKKSPVKASSSKTSKPKSVSKVKAKKSISKTKNVEMMDVDEVSSTEDEEVLVHAG